MTSDSNNHSHCGSLERYTAAEVTTMLLWSFEQRVIYIHYIRWVANPQLLHAGSALVDLQPVQNRCSAQKQFHTSGLQLSALNSNLRVAVISQWRQQPSLAAPNSKEKNLTSVQTSAFGEKHLKPHTAAIIISQIPVGDLTDLKFTLSVNLERELWRLRLSRGLLGEQTLIIMPLRTKHSSLRRCFYRL